MAQYRPVVEVKLGTTLKLQEYENVRMDFRIEDQVHPNESIGDALERIFKIADEKLTREAKTFKS